MTGIYRPDLACQVTVLSYDFCSRIGKLRIDGRDHCDGRAALALFHAIDPAVAQVCVLAGDERGRQDRTYIRIRRWFGVYDGGGGALGAIQIGEFAKMEDESAEGEP
jgi:hypothetical protein